MNSTVVAVNYTEIDRLQGCGQNTTSVYVQ